MTRKTINDRYELWLYSIAGSPKQYQRLLRNLYLTDFKYTLPMDGNRFEDGIDLRYRFGADIGVNDSLIASYLDDRPCSILEMMVALSIRIEEHIMDNPEIGDRTAKWFWGMVTSLGLDKMTDAYFKQKNYEEMIRKFLDREYAPDGQGGLFTLKNNRRDLRTVDIWYQAMWYLNEILNER